MKGTTTIIITQSILIFGLIFYFAIQQQKVSELKKSIEADKDLIRINAMEIKACKEELKSCIKDLETCRIEAQINNSNH